MDTIALSILEKELENTSKRLETCEEGVNFHEEERDRLMADVVFLRKKYEDLKSAIDKLKI
jgi:predicted nuclease with TOPRIM domain